MNKVFSAKSFFYRRLLLIAWISTFLLHNQAGLPVRLAAAQQLPTDQLYIPFVAAEEETAAQETVRTSAKTSGSDETGSHPLGAEERPTELWEDETAEDQSREQSLMNRMVQPAALDQSLFLPQVSAALHSEGTALSASGALPAFPGAEGHGALAVGGRGGSILEVTNLNDSGPGSLRAAINTSGKRIVVFRVAGLIMVNSPLVIKNPYITIAGQTAPGDGITIRAVHNKILQIDKHVHDVVIRYLRLRNGSGLHGMSDNISITGGDNIIIDHVSMSWSGDENLEIWQLPGSTRIQKVSIQRSILAEGIASHSNGLLIGGNTTYNSQGNPTELWRWIQEISIHHNLFVHNSHRNPRVTSNGTEVINNVVYNWHWFVVFTTMSTQIDWRGNYSKAGPMSLAPRVWYHQKSTPESAYGPGAYTPSIFVANNLADPAYPDPNQDNWTQLKDWDTGDPLPDSYRRATPLPAAAKPVQLQPAADAYTSVMADVGANRRVTCDGRWINATDSVDARLIKDVKERKGPIAPIANHTVVGGYPSIDPGSPCYDNDKDGMPNNFEETYHFNYANDGDGPQDTDGDGYTNVEEYLNGTNPRG